MTSPTERPTVVMPILVPDLGMGSAPLRTAAWLVAKGAAVQEGDRLVEVLAGPAVYDIGSPASGRLIEKRVGEDETVSVGECLGLIETGT